jgi:fumarate reductase subunit C
MAPKQPGSTRTAPPMKPGSWPTSPRMRTYFWFGATGFVYLIVATVAIRVVWALGDGPERWAEVQAQLSHPLYIAFHVLALASVIFVMTRFFGMFPKAQPARIGPAKPPPEPVLKAMLYGAWIGLTVLFSAILAGGIF